MSKEIVKKIREVTENQGVRNFPGVKQWASTGCTVLDLAITGRLPGGIPVGRIIQVFGGGSTAKTVLGTTILGFAQKNSQLGFFNDVEDTFDPVFAKLYGLDTDDVDTFKLDYSETIEELFDTYLSDIVKLRDKKVKIVVVDSLTALPTEVETKKDMKDGTYGTSRAKQISVGLRKYNRPMAENNVTLFCVDQTRDNISGFGRKEVTSGGRGLEFYSSVRIYLKHDSRIVNPSGKSIGIWVKFEIVKNKVGSPFRDGRFKILFDYGLDDIASNLYFLSEQQNGEQKAKQKQTTIEFMNEKRKLSTWIKYIEENNLEEDLQKVAEGIWHESYRSEVRKPRVW